MFFYLESRPKENRNRDGRVISTNVLLRNSLYFPTFLLVVLDICTLQACSSRKYIYIEREMVSGSLVD